MGITDLTTVHLRNDLTAGIPDHAYEAPGPVTAGDYDGDGIDSVATFDPATNTFTANNMHAAGGTPTLTTFGHADQHTWQWWPVTGAWQSPSSPAASQGFPWAEQSPTEQNIDAGGLEGALDRAGTYAGAEFHSILVARNDNLVAERYFHGFDRHIAGNIMSCTKTVLSTLLAIGMDRGCVEGLGSPVWTHLPSYASHFDSYRRGITVKNMMDMRGGLTWTETSSYNATVQLGLEPDALLYSIQRPVAEPGSPPGATWLYSNGLPQMGSGILTHSCGSTALEYANQHLFSSLGITAPRWDYTAEGNSTGGGGLFLRPRDMARFGQLFLSDGRLGGEQIVREAWVDAATTPDLVIPGTGIKYGLWWWGATGDFGWDGYPHADGVFAAGAGGQVIFLFPSWNMLVVTTTVWASADNPAALDATRAFVDEEILVHVAP